VQSYLNVGWRRVSLAAVALALCAAVLWLWLRPATVSTVQVSTREFSPAIHAVGTVEAKVIVQVAAKIAGRISKMQVDQGDIVRTGQVLVQMEDSESRAEVERAAANLERAKLGVHGQKAAMLRAQAGLSAAEAIVAKARANRSLASANAARWDKLAAAELVSKMDLEERANAAQLADAELKSAEALREAAAKEVAVQQVAVSIVPQDIAATAAALASVQARKADTLIASPIDGYVVSREVESGTAINPGTPILKLADPRTIWVTVYVDEREAGSLEIGNAAEITLRSMPERTLPGKVARIRRESDRVTEQLTVDVSLDAAPDRLRLGQQAEALIRPAPRKVIALSSSATVQSPNGAGAWTVVDGRLRFRQARLGAVDPAGWVEVLQGLSVGDHVVVAPGKLADRKNEGRRVIAQSHSPALAIANK
jgi:HlyD family secretion protein